MQARVPTTGFGKRKLLAACVAAILCTFSPLALPAVFVNNCNDSGAGSLRNAIGAAPTGQTIDLTRLEGVCSTITLKSGEIVAAQKDLTIRGPGADKLTISAKYNATQYYSRILNHTGTGLLYVQDVHLTRGYLRTNPAEGGCLYSAGKVTLRNAVISDCTARATTATGGGVFARGLLTVKESVLSGNVVHSGEDFGEGGGSASTGLRAYYSSFMGNSAISTPAFRGYFGGAVSRDAETYIFNSTIGFNHTSHEGGGLGVQVGTKVKIINSTISSNTADDGPIGAGYVEANSILIANSTIAANVANDAGRTAGLEINAIFSGASIVMQSTILENNRYGAASTDSDLAANIAITGSNNLIQTSTASVPSDTITGKCAFLGSLQDNGGLTMTQAVLGHSPAINAGNNSFGASFDQRGQISVNGDGNYPRVSGSPPGTPRADIGAYEVNGADEIYDADFDSC